MTNDPKPAAPAAAQRTLLSGRGAPSRLLGTTGDEYVDLVGRLIYGPKASGQWGAGVPFVRQVQRPRTTADDVPLQTAHGLSLTTIRGARLLGDF